MAGPEHPEPLGTSEITALDVQALRAALLHAAYNAARHAYPAAGHVDPTATYLRERCHLPPHLVAWVMSKVRS